MTKLKDLKPYTPNDILTSRKVGNDYEKVPMCLYRLRDLPECSEENLPSRLFEDEDFVIPPNDPGRSWAQAKIGKLYLEWAPDGKGSFSLTIKYIDKKNKTLQSFLNVKGSINSKIELHDLLPFHLFTYFELKGTITRDGEEACERRSCAYELKMFLTKLLLDETPTADELRNFQENCKKLSGVQVTYFSFNPHKKPTTLFEISAHNDLDYLSKKRRSEAEIDQWLQEKLLPNLSLKERKEGYLLGLENIINELDREQKRSLAFHILNSSDHFLKKERHLFRFSKYSNNTFSIYELARRLLLEPGEHTNARLIIEDEEHHQEYVLSRYP
ncbi:hypothetical protein DGG96_19205 [Legionella qingyii]|uniref:Uncharacterized protein n=1 Tax=Legionella qingyii TaxID=2184757 RepID=A0A317TX79_9GAMM|nr:hypothetical protein [Legionella qingyii]PWY54031.1 hypothetical protein DGG96_19205 [Legionella qingyii]RUR19874.1 hypothetical protein ELY20_15245 [Legionella qingyii]RUR22346.1 hypothetical protein ELY16_14950 [Legionella qingyii]